MRNKIAIYTSIFGGKDTLREQIKFENVDYFCFTDNKDLKSDTFQIKYYPATSSDPVRSAKIFKMLPHIFLKDYEYTIWIDGNIILSPQFMELFKYLEQGDIALFKHPHRDCMYIEAAACVKRNKDNHYVIKTQVKQYHKEGYPGHNGLNTAGVIFRRNKSENVKKLNNAWWEEIQKFSRRDQLSFNYVLWKNKLNVVTIDLPYETGNRHFKIDKHIIGNSPDIPEARTEHQKMEDLIRTNELIRKEKLKKKVIYTAIFGKIDDLIEPEGDYSDFDFVCFTDRKNLVSKKYKIIRVNRFHKDPTLDARMYKLLPHIFLPQYEYSIWIDGRVIIKKKDLTPLLDYLGDANLAVFPHMHRDCIYEEAKACVYRGKDKPLAILNQITQYNKEKYPTKNGGVETGVLLRKHMQKDVIELQNHWWNELLKYSKRDQISFNYVAWKQKFKFKYIDGHVWDNKYFRVLEKHMADSRKLLSSQ